ncbi:MAG: alpha/beta hydrolase [Firmicutes bacterium]|nr:alpha/beta hydrolase [Bacillota bacterium]
MECMVRDIPIYYEVYGEGKPVVCIHGYTVDHRLMTGCLEPVFEQTQGYKRIYLDLPGMGKTPSARWLRTAEDMLALLKEWIDTVIPGENLLLAGESYGGYLTLGLVHDLPERINGAMLICPAVAYTSSAPGRILPRRLGPPARHVLHQSPGLKAGADASAMAAFLEMAVIATPETYEKYRRDILPGIRSADTDFLYRHFGAAYSDAFVEDLEAMVFEKPSCIVTGRQDHVVGYADAYKMLDRFPRATFAVLDGSGHNLQIEAVPVFNRLVMDWLGRVETGPGDARG